MRLTLSWAMDTLPLRHECVFRTPFSSSLGASVPLAVVSWRRTSPHAPPLCHPTSADFSRASITLALALALCWPTAA